MSKLTGFEYKQERAGLVVQCKLVKSGLNPGSISFYYGKSSYLSIAKSSHYKDTYDAQWYINDS